MVEYPYFAPVVMTENIFLLYGGQTGTSSSAQRNIAFWLAEEQLTEYLNSFLIPTVVTGTYFWKGGNPIRLDYGHIIQVQSVSVISHDWSNSCTVDTVTGCHAVRGNGEYGLIDVSYFMQCGGCQAILGLPYNVQVAYESGLQTGTSNQPSMLQALTLAAQINLNELDVSLSNEGTADIGITDFTNHKYSEKRMQLLHTVFGNSPVANRIARLVRKYKSRPSIGFH